MRYIGVELRFSHHTNFPSGKLLVNWHQIEGHLFLDERVCSYKNVIDAVQKQKPMNDVERQLHAAIKQAFDK